MTTKSPWRHGRGGETAQDKRARKAFGAFDRKVKSGYDEVFRKAQGRKKR